MARRERLSVIGQPLPRVEAMQKVTGMQAYADDLAFPGMLHARMLRSTRPHARIRAIDTSGALALPGVHAVITGRDLPVNYGIMPIGEDEHGLAQDKVRYVGDGVAAVAADDEWTAQEACRRIAVEYEDLPSYMTVDEALTRPGEPIHPQARDGNLHKAVALEFGDVDGAFAAAEHVREDLVDFSGTTHLAMEEHSAVAVPQGGDRLILYSGTQNPHYVHKALARVLAVPPGHVRVVAVPVGGGFGGKCDPFQHEIVAGKLALLTGRPVKITLTREEVFYNHRGRHPVQMWLRSAWTREGRLLGLHFRSCLDGGAHSSYGVASTYYTGALQTTTYDIPAYRFEGLRAFTNKPPCGPKRGHGTPQPRFALEIHLDKVADELGIDPAELRRRNLVQPFSRTVNHLRVTSCGLAECLDTVVRASGYLEKRGRLPRGRGVGLAVSAYLSGAGLPLYWNGMDHSQVWVRCDRGGGVTVFTEATEIGQGAHTVHAAIVAEVLGLRPDDITLVTGDTAATPVDLGSYSSRVTFMSGNAALSAARKARDMLAAAVAPRLEAEPGQLTFAGGRVGVTGDPDRSLGFLEACQLAEMLHGNVLAAGSYRPEGLAGPYKGSGVGPSPAYSYTAAVVEAECDPDTGEVRPVQVWVAHDIGRAINPVLVRGQVEGGVYMGLGEALMEEQAFRKTLHRTPSMLDYKSPTILEMPEVQTYLVETDDPEGPFGAKEAGQGPLLPVIPALANAVHDALGVRVDEVPITPDKVLKALDNLAAGRPGRYGPGRMPDFAWPAPTRVDPPADRRVPRPAGALPGTD